MPLDFEKASCEKDKNNEQELIASLLSMNQLDVPTVASTPTEWMDEDFFKMKSQRWRDSICTAVRKTDTEISTSPNLWININDLLTDREKEQERLRQIISEDYEFRGVPETFACCMERVHGLIQERNATISTASPRRSKQSYPVESDESLTNEGNLTDSSQSETQISKEFESETTDANLDTSKQSESTVSKESVSQTTVDSLDTLKQSESTESKESASQTTSLDTVKQPEPIVSKDSAAQTIETNLNVSQQTEPVISKDSASQTTVGSLDISKTSGLSSEVPKPTDPTKEVRGDDHVFALPAVPSQRSSSRLMKTRKNSKSEDLLEKSVTTPEAGIRTSGRKGSKDTPDPRRRSSRLSSRSCSEVDEDSESSEEKSKVMFTTKSKQEKKLESSGGESDEGRSTRASRRLKK